MVFILVAQTAREIEAERLLRRNEVRDSNPSYSRSGIGPYLFLASSRFRECLFRRCYVTCPLPSVSAPEIPDTQRHKPYARNQQHGVDHRCG